MKSLPVFASLLIASAPLLTADADEKAEPVAPKPVSYYEEVLPLFQAKCHGCHQPAKAKGDYIMTSFEKLLVGGETEGAVIPGDPDKSYLVEEITPNAEGEAEMPKKEKPLHETEIALIRRWIEEGAVNDTPENAVQQFDADNPPNYSRPPVVTSLDFSPDGSLLAIAGFHEVILQKVDAEGNASPYGRLIGLSERIESVKFSPDGTRLAVTGGLPGRMGEVQIWNVEKQSLDISVPVTYDTVYGVSWSPDGSKVAFGCTDNTVRAIDTTSGKQVLFMGSHNDWVLDTVFSTDGSHLISNGRDQTAKLTKVDEERFIDNITSITPGALKGGLASVAKHPERDEILVGGSDGVPQIYRVFRITARKIGDNANLIRKFPAMPGRIWSVKYRPDGQRIAAASSLNGKGAVHIFKSEFDTSLPNDVRAIFGKTTPQRNAKEKARVEEYRTQGAERLHSIDFDTPMFALCYSPDGKRIAASGQDGVIRIIDAEAGKVTGSFVPVEVIAKENIAGGGDRKKPELDISPNGEPMEKVDPAPLPDGSKLVSISVIPSEVHLSSPISYNQLLVTAHYDNGSTADITRRVQWTEPDSICGISGRGVVKPIKEGKGQITASFEGLSAIAKVSISGLDQITPPDWIRDVNPVVSKSGCNAGTCHGAKDGKEGFKLSLRGYDPIFDIRAFTDDHGSRRTNLASPDDSLMLLKATGAVPHEGGQRLKVGSRYYNTIRDWIADGAKLDTNTPKVESIEIFPKDPVIQKIGGLQQFRVVATYPGGLTRDVTSEAFLEVGNTEVAETDEFGLVTALRRGESAILARYEGAYASTITTVMGDRSGFVWEEPPHFNEVDRFTAEKWKRMKIQPSELSGDAEFLRRVHLDLTGLPPTPETVRAFLADERDTRTKRDELIDKLVGSPEFVDYWTNKWADLLQVNRKFLGPEGARSLRNWIHNEVEQNTPYDEFVRKIITAEGSNLENPAAAYFKVLRTPEDTMENTTHLFLATRFNCNKCHDHPFERWTQDQYYETAAFFARTGLKADPKAGGKQIGKTAVEEGKPLYEIVFNKDAGELKHERTGNVTPPDFPYAAGGIEAQPDNRRDNLAEWMTSRDNPLFARSYANRIWGYMFGIGIIEPIDDIRAGNPPTNPELLDWLTAQFLEHDFDVRHLFRVICKSRTYQLSVRTNRWNEDDTINYSHAIARRLPAEVLYDSIYRTTGATSSIPGVPAGTRAAALPDSGVRLPDGFLGNLGRPPRESACECERVSSLELGPIMALVSGPTVGKALSDPNNAIAKLNAAEKDDARLVDEIFVRILNRPASEGEIAAGVEAIRSIPEDHERLVASLDKFRGGLPAEVKERIAKRAADTEAARAKLAAAENAFAEARKQEEAKRKARATELQTEIVEYQKSLPAKLAEWEKAGKFGTSWSVLDLSDLKSTNGATMAKQDDGSILVTGREGKTKYTFNADTDLQGITGIRLEALTDDRLGGKKGPGRNASNGNFVVTEFSITAAPKAEPDKATPVPMQNAKATFSQGGYDANTAIDGKVAPQGNGWAIHPEGGKSQTATFETKSNVGAEGGTRLAFVVDQQYQDGKHALGKFRISATTDPRPFSEGLPDKLAAIVKISDDKRNPEQKKALLDYFQSVDPGLNKLKSALAEAKKPVPAPAEVTSAKAELDRITALPPVSPRLQNLERDVALSGSQLANARLIAAQDLAWALINSPAFLFNY